MARTSKILTVLFLTSTLATFAGCGLFSKGEKAPLKGSPYQPIPGSLDEEYFHTPIGDIAGRYPKGWLRVNLTTIPMENVLAVYTDQLRSRALVLSEIPGTAEFRRNVERDGLVALAEQSFSIKSAKLPGRLTITSPTEIYTVNNKLFASYEYGDNLADTTLRKQNRVALFTTGAKFYELAMVELVVPEPLAHSAPEAGSVAGQPTSPHLENFRLLESVIGSLEGVAQVRGLTDSIVTF